MRNDLRGHVAAAVVALAAIASPARAQSANSPATASAPGPIEIQIDVARSAIPRSNGLFIAAAEIANVGADVGLDALFGASRKRGVKAAFGRLARVWLVNLPIASLAHGVAHDYGHFARLDEAGVHTRRRLITSWPWPIPITISVEDFGAFDTLTSATQLNVFGAGEQASSALRQSLLDKIYSRETSDYFDWLLLGYAALDYSVYGGVDLRSDRSRSAEGFLQGPGDFRQYAAVLATLDPSGFSDDTLRRHSDRLRRDTWINLADFALVASVGRLASYVASGERQSRNPSIKIGKLRFVPGAHATLSALGPERGIGVRLLTSRYLTHVDVRWITTPADQRLWATGFALRSREPVRFLPEARADVFQRPSSGLGYRLEIGGRRALPHARGRLAGSLHVGYKSEGYLADAPRRAGVLFSVSGTVRVK